MSRCWLTLAAFLVATPALWADLRIENVELCYSLWGPPRPDAPYHLSVEPIFIRFDVAGCRQTKSSLSLKSSAKLLGPNGHAVFTIACNNNEANPAFGGDRLRGWGWVPPQKDAPPGNYRLILDCKDNNSAEQARFEKLIRVKAPELAITQIDLALDPEMEQPACTTNSVGTTLFFQVLFCGCLYEHGQSSLRVRSEIFEVKTGERLANGAANDMQEPKGPGDLPVGWVTGKLPDLNRPGDFIIRLHITDRLAGKSISCDIPIHVRRP